VRHCHLPPLNFRLLLFRVVSVQDPIIRILRTPTIPRTLQNPPPTHEVRTKNPVATHRGTHRPDALTTSKCPQLQRDQALRGTHTGCTEGFSGTENYKENAVKTRNSITKFSTLESVMKFKLFLLCHSLNAEKFEFHYTFQGTEFGNGLSSFHSIFFIVFCPRKPFCAPCAKGLTTIATSVWV